MKTRKLSKKLSLNKKTVADINGGEMGKLKGGCKPSLVISGCPVSQEYTCPIVTCDSICSIGPDCQC